MERRALDLELDLLAADAARILANLVDLDRTTVRGLLDVADLRGDTARRWADARAVLERLFEEAAILGSVVADAERARGQWPMTAVRLERYRALVVGASIRLPSAPVAAAERRLLADAASGDACTPRELVACMERDYEGPRSVLRDVAHVWDVLVPQIVAVRGACAALLGSGEAVDDTTLAEVISLDGRAATLAEVALCDPLAFPQRAADELADALRAVEERVRLARDTIARFDQHLAEARAQLDALRRAEAEAIDACARAASKVCAPQPPVPPVADSTLARRLEVLADPCRAGGPAHAGGELRRWRDDAAARLQLLAEMVQTCASLIRERDELRQRLRAYEAKAAHAGRLEDSRLCSLRREAQCALYDNPVDLGQARRLVRCYQDALAEGSNA
jgi:hypothetical protein